MKKEEKTYAQKRISIFLHATFYTLTILALIGFSTYYLDKYLGTFPTIFIIGLIAGFPITQIVIYKKFKKFNKQDK